MPWNITMNRLNTAQWLLSNSGKQRVISWSRYSESVLFPIRVFHLYRLTACTPVWFRVTCFSPTNEMLLPGCGRGFLICSSKPQLLSKPQSPTPDKSPVWNNCVPQNWRLILQHFFILFWDTPVWLYSCAEVQIFPVCAFSSIVCTNI